MTIRMKVKWSRSEDAEWTGFYDFANESEYFAFWQGVAAPHNSDSYSVLELSGIEDFEEKLGKRIKI